MSQGNDARQEALCDNAGKLNHTNTKDVICPHCGYARTDYELNISNHGSFIECFNCDKKFIQIVNQSIATFTTEKR